MMIIRRERAPLFGDNSKLKSIIIASLAVLTISSVSNANTSLWPMQGKSLSIPLGTATPISANDAQMLGFSAPLSPYDPAVNDPVPMPEINSPAMFALPATPPATPSGTPFVMPTTQSAGVAPTPYVFANRNPTDSLRAAICLTTAIYYESASESEEGQRAVAQVVLNRVRHPAWPNTVCGVVYQGSDAPGCQFSFACDGSMARRPSMTAWARASRVAREALAGYTYAPVGLSTFYHTPQVNPAWNKRLIVAKVLGNHIFYRMPGDRGVATAFNTHYFGNEPLPLPKPRAYTPPAFAANKPVPVPSAYANPLPMPAVAQAPVPMPSAVPSPIPGYQPSAAYAPKARVEQDDRYVQGTLPESDIMPAYRDSGTWIKR